MTEKTPKVLHERIDIILKTLGESVTGPKRDSTLALLGYSSLLLSAVLKSVGHLIESDKFIRLQKWSLFVKKILFKKMPKSPYIINTASSIEQNEIYKTNQELARKILDQATIFRKHYSYIANYRVFATIYTSLSYLPQLKQVLESFPAKYQKWVKEIDNINDPTELASLAVRFLVSNEVATVNNFFSQFLMDAAVVGDQNLVGYFTRNSMFLWYWSSRFWFANVLLSLVRQGLAANEGVARFVIDNRKGITKLFLSYHWGWDWTFLNDYQLSILNLYNLLG